MPDLTVLECFVYGFELQAYSWVHALLIKLAEKIDPSLVSCIYTMAVSTDMLKKDASNT